ncbi:hypothetical protein BC792_11982 [Sphingobacterium allocomposti]|uniref:Uncharacterized protein n=1 Tax=Sphingobacterium allocomposti TaxID=415956 RepID=A0A5S5D8A1_9SPHI|nr:hypothetical protein BC792_11982 [Sphingobacterium composti Yoo et al. 2007 non Ten et al. 2007]
MYKNKWKFHRLDNFRQKQEIASFSKHENTKYNILKTSLLTQI